MTTDESFRECSCNGYSVIKLQQQQLKNKDAEIDALNVKLEKAKKYIESVNGHAETCSIFIYDDKGCTCFYKNRDQCLKELGEPS